MRNPVLSLVLYASLCVTCCGPVLSQPPPEVIPPSAVTPPSAGKPPSALTPSSASMPAGDQRPESEHQQRLDAALVAAIRADDRAGVIAKLGQGANVNAVDRSLSTPLMQACAAASLDLVKLLVDRGADLHAVDKDGFTPLMVAAYSGHGPTAAFLIEKGADVNAADLKGHTALMGAAYSHRPEVVQLLLDHGASVNAKDSDGFTALMVASGSGSVECVDLLLKKGADINAATRTGFTPLMEAAGSRQPGVVKLLLERGARVNSRAGRGSSALMVASYSGNLPIVQLLLDHGADVHVKDAIGHTVLIGAAYSGNAAVAKRLLDRGADLNAQTHSGLTALMQAAYSGREDVARLLLERGADVEARTTHDLTALMQAAGTGNQAIVRMLLEYGADVNARDSSHRSALDWAARRDHPEIESLLKEAGAIEIHAAGAGSAPVESAASSVEITSLLPRSPLFPTPDPHTAIHAPRVVGASPRHPFLFRIPATGKGPLIYSAVSLPAGLHLDPHSGILSGQVETPGTYSIRLGVTGPLGHAVGDLTVVCGDHKLAQTPPMGWNAWNVFGDSVTADEIRQQADWMVRSGLVAHGFEYLIIDDTWQGRRDDQGNIGPSKKFGDIRSLADYLHSQGLKLGLLSSATDQTCSGYAGSAGHEAQDAAFYAASGVDYLKYDWCQQDVNYQNLTREDLTAGYQKMRDALDHVDRDIVYAADPYGLHNPEDWGREVGANTWVTSKDILDNWKAVSDDGFGLNERGWKVGPGYWNNPGWLMLGKVGYKDPHFSHLTREEQRTQLSLWSLLAAPLILSCDLSQLDPNRFYPSTTDLLTNDEVLEIDQDPMGRPANRVWEADGFEAWTRPLADGAQAVGIFNRQDWTRDVSIPWDALKLKSRQSVRDLWQHKELEVSGDTLKLRLPPHGVVLLRVGADEG